MNIRSRLGRIESKLFLSGCPYCADKLPVIRLLPSDEEAAYTPPVACAWCGRKPEGVHTLVAVKPANARHYER
jgi:hypothetical protein